MNEAAGLLSSSSPCEHRGACVFTPAAILLEVHGLPRRSSKLGDRAQDCLDNKQSSMEEEVTNASNPRPTVR